MSILDKLGGFLTGGIGEKIASIIDKRVPDRDLATKLQAEMQSMLASQEHELARLAITSEQEADRQQQETVRAELAQSDEYTKRTRPMLARRSWWAVLAYVGAGVISAAATAIPDVPTDWTILTVLASPVLTYMGVRGLEKWKMGGSVALPLKISISPSKSPARLEFRPAPIA